MRHKFYLNNIGALVEDDTKHKTRDDEVPQSMAAASRLANLKEKEDKYVGDLDNFAENEDVHKEPQGKQPIFVIALFNDFENNLCFTSNHWMHERLLL